MPDETHRDAAMPGGGFDDDRLLAYALGLDDDPELVAAAAADDELRARLEAVRAQAEAVGARVAAAVPAPDEDYADLSSPRWAALGEFFEAAQAGTGAPSPCALAARPRAGPRRHPRGGHRGGDHQQPLGDGEHGRDEHGRELQGRAHGRRQPGHGGAGARPRLGDQADRDSDRPGPEVRDRRHRQGAGGGGRLPAVRRGPQPQGTHGPTCSACASADAPAETGKLHLLLLSPAKGATAQAFNEPPPLISVSPAAAAIATATPSPEPSPGGSTRARAQRRPRSGDAGSHAGGVADSRPQPVGRGRADEDVRLPRPGGAAPRSSRRARTSRRCACPENADSSAGRVDCPRRTGGNR